MHSSVILPNGGPGRTRTCNQTVMSARLKSPGAHSLLNWHRLAGARQITDKVCPQRESVGQLIRKLTNGVSSLTDKKICETLSVAAGCAFALMSSCATAE